jgi:hypothetical protein
MRVPLIGASAAFVTVASLHFLATFASCSLAPGNTATQAAASPFMGRAFEILSFPLVYVLGTDFINRSFEAFLILNAAVWGLAAALIVAALMQWSRRIR